MPNTPAEPPGPPGDPSSGWDDILTGRTMQAVENTAPLSRREAREARDSEHDGSRSARRSQLDDGAPRDKKKTRRGWGCLVILAVLLALVAGAGVLLQGPIGQLVAAIQGPPDYTGTGEKKVVVVIHDGDTGSDIAKTLATQNVVKSSTAFYNVLLKQVPAPVFQPGAYQLATKMSARAALDALLDPASRLKNTVVVPEGTVASVVLKSVSEGASIPLADLKKAAADVATFGLPAEATSLEGFLFPATYNFTPGTSAHDAIKTLVDRQFQALDKAGATPDQRWKTIVLASLIQREARLAEDFPKVSRVFLNRLDPKQWKSGLLQSDATVAYGTGNTHRVETTDAERADAGNKYNTYVHPGLPVGPISNPGDVAIDAALHPAAGGWLFFVTWNLDTGQTIFSTTVKEHEAASAKWRSWMKDHPEYG